MVIAQRMQYVEFRVVNVLLDMLHVVMYVLVSVTVVLLYNNNLWIVDAFKFSFGT